MRISAVSLMVIYPVGIVYHLATGVSGSRTSTTKVSFTTPCSNLAHSTAYSSPVRPGPSSDDSTGGR